ncbi:MAG: type II toxin-antitoxin system VapC family toxin, partial [bacterium]
MIGLLDFNVLVALAWPNHVHHQAAVKWFLTNQSGGWATSPLTESGFVRVSSNAT